MSTKPRQNDTNKKLRTKEDKEEKKKDVKIPYAEFVSLTLPEYENLISEHGEETTKELIVTLDNYKGANGKKYKSDYRAILNWVVSRVTEDQKRRGAVNNEISRYSDENHHAGIDFGF